MNEVKIRTQGLCEEKLFAMFYALVSENCGDGCALIVSDDYKRLATAFDKWMFKCRRLAHDGLERDEYDGIINFHDANENFMFSASPMVDIGDDCKIFYERTCIFRGEA